MSIMVLFIFPNNNFLYIFRQPQKICSSLKLSFLQPPIHNRVWFEHLLFRYKVPIFRSAYHLIFGVIHSLICSLYCLAHILSHSSLTLRDRVIFPLLMAGYLRYVFLKQLNKGGVKCASIQKG